MYEFSPFKKNYIKQGSGEEVKQGGLEYEEEKAILSKTIGLG